MGAQSLASGILIDDGSYRNVPLRMEHEITTKKYMDPIHGYIDMDQL